MVRGLSPQSPGRRVFMIFGLMCCFVVSLCVCLVPGPTQYISIFRTPVAVENAVKHQSTNRPNATNDRRLLKEQ